MDALAQTTAREGEQPAATPGARDSAEGKPSHGGWNKGVKGSTVKRAYRGPIAELARLSEELERLDKRRAEIATEIQQLKPHLEKLLRTAGIPTS